MKKTSSTAALIAALFAAGSAGADTITDWNIKAGEIVTESRIGTPPAVRVMAIVQTAVHDAVQRAPRPGAATDAAIAAVHRVTLAKMLPAQGAMIDAAYQAAVGAIADTKARDAGIAAGEAAAAAVLAARLDDGAATPEAYRPVASAGQYAPTAMPAALPWPQRKPWMLQSAAQFRPAAPPALTSDTWATAYAEVQSLGGRTSTARSAAQTDVARFWEYSLPAIYHGVVRSVALQPGRDVAANARLFAAVAQAMDDAMIAVFDAKYHHHFWRPATAVRNGDIDGNDATKRDASWAPLIDTPMHPEYPSAHSILASAVGTLLKAEIGRGAMPVLATTSPTAKGAKREWTSVDAFVREVGDARVWAGIHYRFSVDTGAAMGERVGHLAVQRWLEPQRQASLSYELR